MAKFLPLILLLAFVPAVTAQVWRGFPGRQFFAGKNPRSLITADLNGDGIADLATSNAGSSSVAVLIGNGHGSVGDGTFANAAEYPTGSIPQNVIAGDFNGDGIMDLATSDLESNTVSVLLGNGTGDVGNGTFAAAVGFETGHGPINVLAADFNGDGILDLATASLDGNDVSVLLGNGDDGAGGVSFAAPVGYGAGSGPYNLASADFNGDGIIDLAVANSESGDVSVLLGNGSGRVGDGTFDSAVAYAVGNYPIAVKAADLNGDGISDLAVALFSDDRSVRGGVLLLPGNGSGGAGDGTFGSPITIGAADSAASIAIADFNADGIGDLAIADFGLPIANLGRILLMLGNGVGGLNDGTFANAVPYGDGVTIRDVVAEDFNGDGIMDVASVSSKTGFVSVLLGNGGAGIGDGTLSSPPSFAVGSDADGIAGADFNGDGITDLAVASSVSNPLSVLLGNGSGGIGDGTFATRVVYPIRESALGVVTTGDFNGDGITDLAIGGERHVWVMIGNGIDGVGNGTFASAVSYNIVGGSGTPCIETGDFNGDGILDIATVSRGPYNVGVRLGNGSGRVGDGTFADPISYGADGPSVYVQAADFNADGITDIATTIDSAVSVLLGNGAAGIGDGTFANAVNYDSVGLWPGGLVLTDFNGDGIVDLACANFGDDTVSVLLGKGSGGAGDGTFNDAVSYSAGSEPENLLAVDLNGDRIMDLMVTNDRACNFSVLLGNGTGAVGDGTFAPPLTYGAGYLPRRTIALDLYGDGLIDLAMTNGLYGSPNVTILLNLGFANTDSWYLF